MTSLVELIKPYFPYLLKLGLLLAGLVLWAASHEVLFEKLVSDALIGPLAVWKPKTMAFWSKFKPYLILAACYVTAKVLNIDYVSTLSGIPADALGPVVGPALNAFLGAYATFLVHPVLKQLLSPTTKTTDITVEVGSANSLDRLNDFVGTNNTLSGSGVSSSR